MMQIDRAYVAIALVMLVAGQILGLAMGVMENNRYLSVHIALVMLGFVTLAIYGVLFRLWPAMKMGRLAALQFWLASVSAVGMVVGSYLLVVDRSAIIIAPSSALAIVAALLLGWLFWTRSAPSAG
jgi:hypothetical protein